MTDYYLHSTSVKDDNVIIGKGTKIWHFSHISKNVQIGKNCVIGQNVFIGENVKIGNNVKIQNNVSVYSGVELEDFVFCGPSVVFTNVKFPRSSIDQKNNFHNTRVCKGATLGANSTIICGLTIGKNAFVGAGSVVTKNVLPNTVVFGNPAKYIKTISKIFNKKNAKKN